MSWNDDGLGKCVFSVGFKNASPSSSAIPRAAEIPTRNPVKLPGLAPGVRPRARRAVPALVELLFEGDAEVRAAAWQALRALTGEELPAEPQLWETYAFG